MLDTDKLRFKQAFNRLAVATRLPADQTDAAMQRIYFEGLQRFPIEAVESAAASMAERSQWFPKLAEWCDTAEQARNVRALMRVNPDQRVWQAECEVCDDSGWEILTCSGRAQCGRDKEHGEHDYAVPCPCRLTNRTYQRRRAEERERVRGRRKASED